MVNPWLQARASLILVFTHTSRAAQLVAKYRCGLCWCLKLYVCVLSPLFVRACMLLYIAKCKPTRNDKRMHTQAHIWA